MTTITTRAPLLPRCIRCLFLVVITLGWYGGDCTCLEDRRYA